jgi:hypothetical protein
MTPGNARFAVSASVVALAACGEAAAALGRRRAIPAKSGVCGRDARVVDVAVGLPGKARVPDIGLEL